MGKLTLRHLPIIIVIITFCFSVSPVNAQSLWLDEGNSQGMSLEYLIPTFKNTPPDELSGWSTFLTLRRPSGAGNRYIIELPYAEGIYEYHNVFTREHYKNIESTTGNMYFGYELRKRKSIIFYEFGIRFPFLSTDKDMANYVGALSDLDRYDAFLKDYFTLKALINLRSENKIGLHTRIRIGPVVWVHYADKGAGSRYNPERFELMYYISGQLWLKRNRLTVGGGISAVTTATEDNLIIRGRAIYQLGAALSYAFYYFRPGMHIRLPLENDLGDIMGTVIAFNVQVLTGEF